MDKKTVLVLFGGNSFEHEVSRESAATVISNLDGDKYYCITVGITKDGAWMLYSGDVAKIRTGEWEKYASPAVLTPDASRKVLIKIVKDKIKNIPIDVVFPVLHGLNGEDGTIQGLLEMMNIPYVGCGVLSSAVSMDKAYTKLIAANLDINQADYMVINKWDAKENMIDEIEKKLGYPCFIKPSNTGSSVGICKARDRDELSMAYDLAFQYDKRIVAEMFIDGREFECSVLGYVNPFVSTAGEIVSAGEFYDYDSKYHDKSTKIIIPADIPADKINEMKDIASKIFMAVDGYGIARVDFFIENKSNKIFFNEINTMPGFTSASMYPVLLEHEGKTFSMVIDELIELAEKRKL